MDVFVHGLFRDEEHAAVAVRALIDAHFDPDLINALMREGTRVEAVSPTFKQGVAPGAAVGGALGVAGGMLIAAGGLLAGGPVALAVAGGLAGTLAGAIGGLANWTDEVDFSGHVEDGMILIGVTTEQGSVERARAALVSAQAGRIHVLTKGEARTEVETGVRAKVGAEPRPG